MYFVEEIQKISDSPVQKWLLTGLYTLLAMAVGAGLLSWQLQKNEMIGLGFAVVTMLASFIFIFRMASYVKLDRKGLAYRHNPFSQKRKRIPLEALISWDIVDHKFYHGIGYGVKPGMERIFVFKPGKALLVKTRDGKQFRFGINRPDLVRTFINNNWESNTELYG